MSLRQTFPKWFDLLVLKKNGNHDTGDPLFADDRCWKSPWVFPSCCSGEADGTRASSIGRDIGRTLEEQRGRTSTNDQKQVAQGKAKRLEVLEVVPLQSCGGRPSTLTQREERDFLTSSFLLGNGRCSSLGPRKEREVHFSPWTLGAAPGILKGTGVCTLLQRRSCVD